jgi:hypothetical protein
MRHPLTFLLRVGRSDDDRVSLLGDIEEERRARHARGSSRLAVFAWSTAEICRALLWGLRDALVRRALAPRARFMLSWADIKLSLRLLIRNPGLTAVSTVGIAVGIAIASAMFGYIHSNFDPALPLDEGHRIVALENWDIEGNNENPSFAARLRDLARSNDVRRRDQRISRTHRDDAGGRLCA